MPESDIFVVGRDGKGRTNLTRTGGLNLRPRFSPVALISILRFERDGRCSDTFLVNLTDALGVNAHTGTQRDRRLVAP